MLLLSDKKIKIDGNIYKLSWEEFEYLAKIISDDILKQKYDKSTTCLLGTARGALPLLTYVSHKTGIRNISVVQLQMTNSDNPFDYGEVKLLLNGIREDFENFIILEDIVYKGNTVKEIIKLLKNKKIEKIYSLVIDEGYFACISNKIYSASILEREKWVKFPWE